MVNVENVRKLREAIASEEMGFAMHIYRVYEDCGTAGCIAGHAAWIWPDCRAEIQPEVYTYSEGPVCEKLGLTEKEGTHLFYPVNMSSRTRPEALAVLDHLIETGEVVWDEAKG